MFQAQLDGCAAHGGWYNQRLNHSSAWFCSGPMHQCTVNASEVGTNGTSSRLVGGHLLGQNPLLVEGYVLFGVRVCAVCLLGNY